MALRWLFVSSRRYRKVLLFDSRFYHSRPRLERGVCRLRDYWSFASFGLVFPFCFSLMALVLVFVRVIGVVRFSDSFFFSFFFSFFLILGRGMRHGMRNSIHQSSSQSFNLLVSYVIARFMFRVRQTERFFVEDLEPYSNYQKPKGARTKHGISECNYSFKYRYRSFYHAIEHRVKKGLWTYTLLDVCSTLVLLHSTQGRVLSTVQRTVPTEEGYEWRMRQT